ncbi:MAG: IS66 family transposase, partial [Saccharospirillum sp.]|uniref:IS66 family transposase n=1 Tax=Saccharospirillum sp. TaxID=2033801 RepID=UPI0034A04513
MSKLAANTEKKPTEPSDLVQQNAQLQQEINELKRQLDWFKKQIFGQKSEKRSLIGDPGQISLLAATAAAESPPKADQDDATKTPRGTAKKQRSPDCVNDAGLRFDDSVPVEIIQLMPSELTGPEAELYEIIGNKSTFRIAQRTASYVIIEYQRPVFKLKDAEQPLPSPAPDNVLDRSVADVSLLVGLLVDKFQYHLPLHRQHQRLTEAGITLSRATLTNLVKRAIDLLKPIVAAQLQNVLLSRVLAMDETPIKAGKTGKGKMNQAWFWPLYGERDEVVFTFSKSRGRQHIEAVLGQSFQGTLLSDGHSAYTSYVERNQNLTQAQCWVHSRRQFVNAADSEPEAVAQALDFIGKLYQLDDELKRQPELSLVKRREYRLTHCKPVVDDFFEWCHEQLHRPDLLPKDPFAKALGYVRRREHELRVFLEEPDVPMDTNHLERALRPIPMGRRNWLFCWSELGAEHVGVIQSLITTCKLHDINPYTYLTDVLLRIGDHPAKEVQDLTPRLWKERFAANPRQSDLYMACNHSVE